MTYYIEELFVVRYNKKTYICFIDTDTTFKDVLSDFKLPLKESELTIQLKYFFSESALKKYGSNFRLTIDDIKNEIKLIDSGKSYPRKNR